MAHLLTVNGICGFLFLVLIALSFIDRISGKTLSPLQPLFVVNFSAAYFHGLQFATVFYEIYILEHNTLRSVEPLPVTYLAHSPTTRKCNVMA